jgi:hypothetical protein
VTHGSGADRRGPDRFPGGARIADPPAPVAREQPWRTTGLVCIWAIYATLTEVEKRCGVARNLPVEAALAMYADMPAPEAVRGTADRLLASSPPVACGTCL